MELYTAYINEKPIGKHKATIKHSRKSHQYIININNKLSGVTLKHAVAKFWAIIEKRKQSCEHNPDVVNS